MTITGRTMVYHRTEPPRIVTTQAQYDALGDGWADTPEAFTTPEPQPRRKATRSDR